VDFLRHQTKAAVPQRRTVAEILLKYPSHPPSPPCGPPCSFYSPLGIFVGLVAGQSDGQKWSAGNSLCFSSVLWFILCFVELARFDRLPPKVDGQFTHRQIAKDSHGTQSWPHQRHGCSVVGTRFFPPSRPRSFWSRNEINKLLLLWRIQAPADNLSPSCSEEVLDH
jgi:hypothetical protein